MPETKWPRLTTLKEADMELASHRERIAALQKQIEGLASRIAAQSEALSRVAARRAIGRRDEMAALVMGEWWLQRHRFPAEERDMKAVADRAVAVADALIAALDRKD